MSDISISEDEKRTVLELLPAALNEAGIVLALGDPSPALMARATAALCELEAEGRVRQESTDTAPLIQLRQVASTGSETDGTRTQLSKDPLGSSFTEAATGRPVV